MSKSLRCPNCQHSGVPRIHPFLGHSSAREANIDFDIRGQWKNRPVYRCNSCKVGLTAGLLGLKKIGDVLWARMEISWAQNFGNTTNPVVARGPAEVTCHRCNRTGKAAEILAILRQDKPPAPQFVLVGQQEGFEKVLAWCTLCPVFMPSVTEISPSGELLPFTAASELVFFPLQVTQQAVELMKRGEGTPLGKSYFLELFQQLRNRTGQ